DAVAVCESPAAVSGLGDAPGVVRGLAVRDSVLAGVSFLLDAPADSLEAPLQVRALSASQECESESVVRHGDASGRDGAVSERGADSLGDPVAPVPFSV